mgnify:CR=1 FL=1
MTDVNDRFPALLDYIGPDAGMFYCVHHHWLFEYCWSAKERLDVIDTEKPPHERAIRRRHLCRVKPEDGNIPAQVWAEGNRLRDEGNRLWAEGNRLRDEGNRLWAESERLLEPYRAELQQTYLRLIPKCRWNGRAIVFGDNP